MHDTKAGYRLDVPCEEPYAQLIESFIAREFAPTIRTRFSSLLDTLTDVLIASGQMRYGPRPSAASEVAIREVITYWLDKARPIPFVLPWGSEKPNGSGVDIAELAALKTLQGLLD